MANEIFFVISNLAGGGAEGVCVTLANELSEKGFNISLVVLNENNNKYNERLNEKVNYIVLGIPRARKSVRKLYTFFKERPTAKILSFDTEVSFVLLLLKTLILKSLDLNIRNINTVTNGLINNNSSLREIIFCHLYLKLLNYSNRIVCQSIDMRNDLIKHNKKLDSKISVIYNPVRKKYAVQNRHKLKIKENYILYVGRLESQKSVSYLIDAFELFSRKFEEFHLYIIGEGSQKQFLIDLVAQKQITRKIVFFGFIKNVDEYYKNAAFTALTSQYEGLPNVLIESISFGTPVISFDCTGGIKEVVEPNINGLIIPRNDINALYNGFNLMNKIHWDKERIVKSSMKFDTSKIVKEYINILS